MKKGFLTNKYTLSVFILLAVLATDIYLHKGMSRVMLPESFTDKRAPQPGLQPCNQQLNTTGKRWIKAVNSIKLAAAVDSLASGIEIDVYFDSVAGQLYAYHDSAAVERTLLTDILQHFKDRGKAMPVWLDFKNLSTINSNPALESLLALRNQFSLHNKLIVESSVPQLLRPFCENNFYTSYYVPLFNPYTATEEELTRQVDFIASALKLYPVTALSGYYFQTPFLKRFFPAFPVLTWIDDAKMSLVTNLFNRQLERDTSIFIVLHNADL